MVSPSLFRLNADGSLDATFRPPPGLGNTTALALGADGKIALITLNAASFPQEYTLVRLNADGSQDAGFTPATFAGENFSNDVSAFVLAVQGDGKMLVAGNFYVSATVDATTLERFNTDGTIDPSFQLPPTGGPTVFNSLLPLANGQLLVGGAVTYRIGQDYVTRDISRLNADGSVDTTYNADTGNTQYAYALTPQPEPVSSSARNGGRKVAGEMINAVLPLRSGQDMRS